MPRSWQAARKRSNPRFRLSGTYLLKARADGSVQDRIPALTAMHGDLARVEEHHHAIEEGVESHWLLKCIRMQLGRADI